MVEIEDTQREFNIHIIEVFEEGKKTHNYNWYVKL